MLGSLCLLLIVVTAGVGALPVQAGESKDRYFFVSPAGNDDWSGSLAEPNAESTDGPFATLSKAQEAVRDARAEKPTTRYVVLVRGGTYRLTSPIRFGPEDSGTQGAPVTYAAYPGENPIFSGAREISGWREIEPNVWRSAPFGSLRFDQLYVNGQRRQRARTPNVGYHLTDGALPEPMNTEGFYYRDSDIGDWSDLSSAIVHVLHSWSASVHRIAERNASDHSVTLTNPTAWFGMSFFDRNERYYVENVRAAFDTPGEWFIDPNTNRALYRPLQGEDMTSASVLAPTQERLLIFEGEAEAGQYVENIELEGLSFQHTDWAINFSNMADGQSAQFLDAAIQLRGTRSVEFRNVEVAHVGEYGIFVGRGSRDIEISHAHVHDTGGGGIKLGVESDPSSPELEVRDVSVLDSTIHGIGRVFAAGTAIWLPKASDSTISHNEIYDTYWTAVSVGWTWDDSHPSYAEGNSISYNDIHDIGQGVLNDIGGIYTLGVSPGTAVRNNVVHGVRTHVPTFPYGPVACCGTDAIGWGLYADGMSSEIRFFNNIVYDVQTAAFNEGSNNGFLRVYNNVFDPGGFTSITRSFENTNDPTRLALKFERNIIVSDDGNILGLRWNHNNAQFDNNLYWAPDPLVFWEQYFRPDLSGHYGEGHENTPRTFAEWRSLGQDPSSLIADPMFVDRGAHDYALLPASPAFDLGFEPIEIDELGPRTD